MIPMLFGYLKRGENILQHLTDMGEWLWARQTETATATAKLM